ncbi:hypothetical protein NEOKW01_1591 [Nematocida sp. AWRm80]|nr:hypothetical protein NEOKW01_1591 [Nematocida sp. AWRm80]
MNIEKYLAVIIEGVKSDRANYLYSILKGFFTRLGVLICDVNLDGISMSILNPYYKGTTPSEIECREVFMQLLSMMSVEENFIFICDSLTEPYERRELYLSSEYSTETNCIFILEHKNIPEISDRLGVPLTNEPVVKDICDRVSKIVFDDPKSSLVLSPIHAVRDKCLGLSKKKYTEKICILLAELKKRAIQYYKTKLSQGIYLFTRYSTLYLLHTGYTLYYTSRTPILSLVSKVLVNTTTKKKWSLYFSTYHKIAPAEKRDRRRDSTRSLKSEYRFKQELKTFCEKEKIGRILHPGTEVSKETLSQVINVPKIELPSLILPKDSSSKQILEILVLLEGLDKTLIISSVHSIKTILACVKKTPPAEMHKQTVPLHAIIKLTVKGVEITEQRHFITRGEGEIKKLERSHSLES